MDKRNETPLDFQLNQKEMFKFMGRTSVPFLPLTFCFSLENLFLEGWGKSDSLDLRILFQNLYLALLLHSFTFQQPYLRK
ncbi:hypothetical protein LEP1GSC021_3131 [Leptospira noguchii str. 1993005606]|uniref:Uncharacterized protein n=1 Tax=Leptospira noguchii str. 2007001578 TaxID=1049974 RepID=A0ABN0IVU7_9LEPT|nr:hypothetical protein LEP1GSC072_0429 [Leptospira noguchii str. Bonito]EMM98748.1 hypothetical protein LEP1GSC035_4917 [Leptospira noguchii str. 2007001578]EMS84451.1 hypothetical protein LEP1GSC073_2287 [Leptospira noguchii str. Cascata]EPE85934.1 hypothetical protein LEP1GSC021_3131 [Leptospira noguchii str. 1993005606]